MLDLDVHPKVYEGHLPCAILECQENNSTLVSLDQGFFKPDGGVPPKAGILPWGTPGVPGSELGKKPCYETDKRQREGAIRCCFFFFEICNK